MWKESQRDVKAGERTTFRNNLYLGRGGIVSRIETIEEKLN